MIELSLVLKSTVVLAFGLAGAALMRRARASVRHLWLAAALGAVAALPVASLAAPPVAVEVPSSYVAMMTPAASPAPNASGVRANGSSGAAAPLDRATTPSWTWIAAVRAAWIAGMAAMLASLLLSLARVRRIRRDGLPRTDLAPAAAAIAAAAGIRRRIELLEHEDVPAPLTCGFWRPAIVLPRDARAWNDADVRRALVHEIEHIARGDWAVQIGARAVCAAYWFHPLAWTALRRLCLEAERAADDAVLRSDDRADYADQLLLLTTRFTAAPARAMVGMAKRSDLSARVAALLDDRLRRGHAGAFPAAAAFAAAAVLVAAIAPVRASGAAPAAAAAVQEPPRPKARAETGPQLRAWNNVRPRAIDRALLEAAEDGQAEEVDQLLQAGANVNAAVDGDGSPLIAAARAGRLAIVTRLLDRGADPNLAVPGDGSPLIAAAAAGATNIAAVLLDRGANIELVVPGDENALIQASASGHLATVKLLVARGANVNARVWVDEQIPGWRGEYRTPLSMARRGRNAAVVDFLIASGARD